jgi:hypothetical protein
MKISPLYEQDVRKVTDNLWDRGRTEVAIMGVTQDQLCDKFMSMVGKPFTGAFHDDEGNLCAIIALELLAEYSWRTHFAAVEHAFQKIAFPLTRFLAQFSKQLIKDSGGKIEILSAYNESSEAGRWYRVLGFSPDGAENGIYRYIKKG